MVGDILDELARLGVTVIVVAEDRIRLEPASRIPADLMPRIREAKPAILEALRERPALGQEPPDAVRRFAQPHARLFPLLGRKVRTPAGIRALWQVFAERSGVLLDKDAGKVVIYFPTEQIEPVSKTE